MPCPSESVLAEFLDGQLDMEGELAVARHMDGCGACREVIAFTTRSASLADRKTSPDAGDDAAARPRGEGKAVSRYVLLRILGAGGMGVVYLAHDQELDRQVAIKVLRPGAEAAPPHATQTARLRQEAQAMAKLAHPNVIAVHDVGTLGGHVFFAMERVVGMSAEEWLRASPRTWREILGVFTQAGAGLAAAHDAGIVHRDFKPENVLVGDDGRVRVTDFGLARSIGAESKGPVASGVAGTKAYVAPEHARGEKADARSDQYSFARTLAGALRDAPSAVHRVLTRATRDKPEERYASMGELLAALEKAAGPRTVAPFAVAAVALAVVVVGVLAVRTSAPRAAAPATSALPVSGSAAPPTPPFALALSSPRRLTSGSCAHYPSFTPDGGTLLFGRLEGEDGHLYTLDLAAGTERQLTRGRGRDIAPRVSPDGRRVVFIRRVADRIATYVGSLDGRDTPRELVTGQVLPSWSRDGKSVWAGDGAPLRAYDVETGAVVRSLGEARQIRSLSAVELSDGSVVVAVITEAADDTVTVFSPSGQKRELFRGVIRGNVAVTPDERHALVSAYRRAANTNELVDVPLDGSPIGSLATSGVAATSGLALAPDGKRLAWSSCNEVTHIVGTDARGKLSRVVLPEMEIAGGMAFLPGTSKALVVSARPPWPFSLWLTDLHGDAGAAQMLPGDVAVSEVAVSPDGARFVVSVENVGLEVGSVGEAGRLRRITRNPTDSDPAFLRDGARIAFTSNPEKGAPQVLVVPAEGSAAPAPLLEPSSFYAAPSPVTDEIAYLAGPTRAQTLPKIWSGGAGGSRPLSPAFDVGYYEGIWFSLDGRRVAVVRGRTSIVEVDVATGVVLRTLSTPEHDGLSSPRYTADGLVALRQGNEGHVWLADVIP